MQTLEDPVPGYKDLYYPTHKALCNFIEKNAREGQKCLILLPRGWIKSYIFTVAWSIQRMLRNMQAGIREHTIISNATIGNAKEFLEKIKYNLKYNELLYGLFSEFLYKDPDNDAERWTQDEIQLHGNRIETGSVEGNLVSRHYKIMINDDLVNRDNSLTADQINKVIDWWKLAQSLLLPTGIEVMIGTRWQFDDLYGHMIDNFIKVPKEIRERAKSENLVEWDCGRYHLFQMSCWEDPIARTGSTFPTMFPEERLKEIEAEQSDRFGGQYLNDPLAMTRNPFKPSWFNRRWIEGEIPPVVNTIMLIDPSGVAKDTSDWSGAVVIDIGSDKKGYVKFANRKLVTDLKLCEWIIDLAIQYEPGMICIEETKYNVIREQMELYIPKMILEGKVQQEYIDFVRMIPYLLHELRHRGRPKEVRIRNLTGWFESRRFLLPVDGVDNFLEELLRFPGSRRDDIVDAMGYVLDVMTFPSLTDPPKYLELTKRQKMTTTEKEEEDWKQYVDDVYHDQPPDAGVDDFF